MVATRTGSTTSIGSVETHELNAEINDEAFAVAMADRLHELMEGAA